MEVFLETGETITAHNLKTQAIPPKYHPVRFALEDENRQDLYDRIDRRVGIMLENGLIGEIKALLNAGAVLLLYKPLSRALRHFGRDTNAASSQKSDPKRSLILAAVAVAIIVLALLLLFFVMDAGVDFGK